jgi:hypothetical protein
VPEKHIPGKKWKRNLMFSEITAYTCYFFFQIAILKHVPEEQQMSQMLT